MLMQLACYWLNYPIIIFNTLQLQLQPRTLSSIDPTTYFTLVLSQWYLQYLYLQSDVVYLADADQSTRVHNDLEGLAGSTSD